VTQISEDRAPMREGRLHVRTFRPVLASTSSHFAAARHTNPSSNRLSRGILFHLEYPSALFSQSHYCTYHRPLQHFSTPSLPTRQLYPSNGLKQRPNPTIERIYAITCRVTSAFVPHHQPQRRHFGLSVDIRLLRVHRSSTPTVFPITAAIK